MRLRRIVSSSARYLDSAAEQWLGWSLEPVAKVVADAGWERDRPCDYCSICGDSVGAGEATESGCGSCRNRPRSAVDRVVRLGSYSGDLRRWILQVKYHGRWAEMGAAMGDWLGVAVLEQTLVPHSRALVVPMPMPWQRRLYRGIDHARTIASGLGRRLRAPLVPILVKSNGPPQVSLASSERERSGARGLRIRRRLGGWSLQGLHVVLVDDVRTTGASLRSAARLLRTLRPEQIIAAVVAVSDADARRKRDQLKAGDAAADVRKM